MVNSTIAAGSGCISALIVAFISCKDTPRVISPAAANNGLLGGLVAVTAGCGTVDPEGAFVIGVVAGAVYVFSSKLMLKLKIDDVVDAAPVHLFCGSWGFLQQAYLRQKASTLILTTLIVPIIVLEPSMGAKELSWELKLFFGL